VDLENLKPYGFNKIDVIRRYDLSAVNTTFFSNQGFSDY
jgi:hypothetical protein